MAKKDTNPMAVNILKLQRYNFKNFSLEEVVFFEYMIVKAQSFKFKEFYHSSMTIARETGIKRSKLNTIIDKFVDLAIIEVVVKGFPLVKHFRVNFSIILELLPTIYKFSESKRLHDDFSKLLTDFYKPLVEKNSQKNNNKNKEEETIKETVSLATGMENEDDYEDLEYNPLLEEVTGIFNDRRAMATKASKGKKIYKETNLHATKQVSDQMNLSLTKFEIEDIRHAFMAYADEILEGEVEVRSILGYFFTYDKPDFPVIIRYLDLYNTSYSHKGR